MNRPHPNEPQRHQPDPQNDETKLGPPSHQPERHPPGDNHQRELRGYPGVCLGQQHVSNEIHLRHQPNVIKGASHALELALGLGLKRLLQWGLPLSAAMLLFPAPPPDDGLLIYNLVHLGLLQIAALLFAAEIEKLLDHPWFPDTKRRWLASAASLVALVTGFAALLTLATSAAARYDVSLQFLQLLSSLDIAWVTAALFFGAMGLWRPSLAWAAAVAIVVACIGSIAAYLIEVGFTPEGGWVVSGADLMTIVIPTDTVAAVISITVLLVASQRNDQLAAQRSPQS